MVRKPALALVRPDLHRPRLPVGAMRWPEVRLPEVRKPGRRALLATVSAVVALGLAYLLARETSLFAFRAVDVAGGPPVVAADVRAALRPYAGKSLVALDASALARTLEALPSVHAASVDRDFPHTLRVVVEPEQPLALVRAGGVAWLVSADDRVIRRLDRGPAQGFPYPVVHLGPGHRLDDGATVADPAGRLALAALAAAPKPFPVRIRVARVWDGNVTFLLAGGLHLRLGDAGLLALKTAVAARVLETLGAADRAAIAYLDVSVPDRPVSG